MGDFVDIPFTTSKSDFEDLAMQAITAARPDWVPEEGDPETILIEAFSPAAVNLGILLSSMSKAALINLGAKLLGVSYGNGQSAYTNVEFDFQDTNGPYTVPAFSGLIIDGYGFMVQGDVTCPNGFTTAVGLVASTDQTADANGLQGAVVSPMVMPGFVVGMTVLAPTIGGVDPQTDDDFADQVSRDRRLNSKAIIVPLDFELAALDVQGITRAHADVPSTRNVTVTVLGVNGGLATTAQKSQVAAQYTTATKMVNATVTINDPTFNTVGVIYSISAETGFDAADTVGRVNTELIAELSALTHGVPESGDPGNALTTWINDPYIYLYRMIQVIGEVNGVHRVVTIQLTGIYQAKLSAALTAGAAITSISLSTVAGSSLLNTIPSGAVVTLTDTATGNTDSFTTTAQVNPGASSIPVTSHAPVHAYPTATTQVSGPVSGDFQMSGTVPVPIPGAMSGSAV